LPVLVLFSWDGEGAGLEGGFFSPWAHNAGAAYKGAGPTLQYDRNQSALPGRHPGVRRVARGKPCRMIPFLITPGRVGGEGTGKLTNLPGTLNTGVILNLFF